VKNRGFREDLFFRLNVLSIELPPLRERRDDIPLLVDHFLKLYSEQHNRTLRGFTRRATEALLHYDYPGNLREMQNLIERGVIFADDGGMIDAHHMFRSGEHLPIKIFTVAPGGALKHRAQAAETSSTQTARSTDPLQPLVDSGLALPEVERRMYETALSRSGGNVSSAARALGLSRATLDYRLRKLNLLPPWSSARGERG
jgi:transcriptional regulator with PAS, ATPase and Fis domain